MKEHLKNLITSAVEKLKKQGELDPGIVPTVHIERTRDKEHGDFASNIALVLAKVANKKPRDLAALIIENLPQDTLIKETAIAGPGFINFYMSHDLFLTSISDVLEAKEQYGLAKIGQNQKINIEFVSSNPTGPLHVGHGRGAAYGGAVSDLLTAAGFMVHREYYVNDAGRQMNILAVSVWLRYLELFGARFDFPSNGYKGEYIKAIAEDLKAQYANKFDKNINEVLHELPPDEIEGQGDKEAHIDGLIMKAKELLGAQYREVFDFGLNAILTDIREDLAAFGVNYQTWFSERSLVESGAIEHAVAKLRAGGHLYEREGATWFHSVPFGDDKDRVLIRENGQSTYFASDAAYLLNKIERGYDQLFYIVGADHHGYIPRLKAVASALGIDPKRIHVLIVQFAVLYRGEERVQMSTRSGSFVTLRDLREEVGKDAARFFYVTRKAEQHMDFDLELAKSQSSDNPVYYIQYAHARICSVFRQLAEKKLIWNQTQGLESLAKLTEEHEKTLLVDLSKYQEIVAASALAYEPHQLANFLREIAHDFHTYYNACQFIVSDDALRNARLSLIAAVSQVLKNGLKLLNVSAPENM